MFIILSDLCGFVFDIIVFLLFILIRSHGGHLKTKGITYLSNIRMAFVAKLPLGHFTTFDMPLVCVTPYVVSNCQFCAVWFQVYCFSFLVEVVFSVTS